MSELFNEVDEEVRRDQLKKLWDQYSIYIIALALLIIAGVGGWRGYQYLEAKKAAEAGAAFDKAAELSEQNKHAEAEAAFADLAAKAPSGYRILARLRTATEVASRDPQAAAKMFDEIAADRSVGTVRNRIWRGFAPRNCCWNPPAIPTCCSASSQPPRRPRPSATPRANCWRCRRGAPMTRLPRGSGST